MNDIAHLDFDRFARRGYAEAVFCLGKTAAQCGEIARMWRERAAAEAEVGAFLSGGTDSSTVAGMLTKVLGRPAGSPEESRT